MGYSLSLSSDSHEARCHVYRNGSLLTTARARSESAALTEARRAVRLWRQSRSLAAQHDRAISRGFDAGNYANAYETTHPDPMAEPVRFAKGTRVTIRIRGKRAFRAVLSCDCLEWHSFATVKPLRGPECSVWAGDVFAR